MRTSCPPAKTVNESPGYAMKFSKQPELIFSVLTAFGVNFIGETILELRSILLGSVDKYSIDSNAPFIRDLLRDVMIEKGRSKLYSIQYLETTGMAIIKQFDWWNLVMVPLSCP